MSRLAPLAASVAAVLIGAAVASASLPYQLDDAYIAYRYADHLSSGHGAVFNIGASPVEGFTSPAWVILLGGIALIGGREALPAAGSALGAVCSAVCVLVALWIARRTTASNPVSATATAWAGAITAVLLATMPGVTYYAMTGMDAPLFLLVVLVFAGAVDGAVPLRYGVVAGAVAVAVRPEGPWLAVMLAAQLIGSGRWRRLRSRDTVWLVGALATGALAVVAVRLIVFGLPLPHTYYAKQADLSFAWRYVVDNLTEPHAIALIALAVAGAVLGGRRHRGYLTAALVWIPAVLIEGEDWMPAGRFLLPCTSLLSVAASGLALATGAIAARHKTAVVALVAGGVLAATALQTRESLELSSLARKSEASIRREARYVIDWMATNGAGSVAAVDIGLLGFTSGAEIVDLGGLTDPVLGGLPGMHLAKPIDPAYVLDDRRPDVIVIRIDRRPSRGEDGRAVYHPIASVERTVLGDPAFAAAYRLELMVVPKNDDRDPYYGRLVFARNDFDTSAAAHLTGKVVQLD